MDSEKTIFDDDWKIWIWTNVSRGCSKAGIFKILTDNGFSYGAIKQELNYEPTQPVGLIANPLLAEVTSSQAESSISQPTAPIQHYFPNANKIATDQAEIYTVDNFLSAAECQALVALIKGELIPSTITNNNEVDAAFRTSRTCSLSQIDHPLVKEIDRRLCQYIGINPHYSEGIQGQHYEIGQEFKAHTDYFEAHELQTFGAEQGQRTWTFMLYLNDTQQGGETAFKKLGKTFRPTRGQGIIWNSLNPDGSPNPDTLHQAKPVQSGEKTIITKWFRAMGQGKYDTKTTHEKIAPLTTTGFQLCQLPKPLFKKLSLYLEENHLSASKEVVKEFIKGSGGVASEVIELSPSLKDETHHVIQPILETWSGIALEPTYVYGIRRYKRGASLKSHRDRLETHIVSATINIFQDIDEDWPLEIEDHFYRRHQIIQTPGEMILYEGARLLHGRPSPLKGEAYASIFVHYKPRIE